MQEVLASLLVAFTAATIVAITTLPLLWLGVVIYILAYYQ